MHKNAKKVNFYGDGCNSDIKKGKSFAGFLDVVNNFGLSNKNYTVQEFLLSLPTNIDFQFTNNLESEDIHLIDTPEKYGIIQVHRGFSNNYCTILFYSADINSIWRYNFHTENSSANGWIKLTSNEDLQGGRIAAITCSPGNITEYNLTFPKRFLSVPKVMLTIASNSTSAKYGSLLPMINSVTVSGCVIRIANNSDIQLSPAVDWIAINI